MRRIIFIFYLLHLLFAVPSYAQEQDSSFQILEFGKARIISCFTGIRGQQKLYAGIHILPDQAWSVKTADLSWTASDGSVAKGFIPFFQPLEKEVIYPAIFLLKQNKQKAIYAAQGTVQACHQQAGCRDFPIQFELSLIPQIALQTPQCAAILSALAQAPKPWPNSIRGQAVADSTQTAHITLQLPQATKEINLFHIDHTPLILQHVQREPFFITFDLPISNPQDVHFLLQTQNDVYEVRLPILDKATPKMLLQLPMINWMILLLLSLIFSPLFMVWGANNQTSATTCKKFNFYICISIGLAMLIGICCAWFPQLWVTQPLNKWLSIGLIIATLLWGKASPFLIFLGLLLMPKPLWDTLQLVSTRQRIIFILILGLIWLFLFGWQIKYADDIHRFFKKWHKITPFSLRASFSLFLFLLLCYTIFSL